MIDIKPFQAVPAPPNVLKETDLGSLGSWLRRLWEAHSWMRLGKLSNVFYAELDTTGTSTIVKNAYLSPQSIVIFNPLNAAAAGIWTSIYAKEADRGQGQWTLTHANTTGLGVTAFLYAIVG